MKNVLGNGVAVVALEPKTTIEARDVDCSVEEMKWKMHSGGIFRRGQD